MVVLSVLMAVIAGVSKAVMDTLSFHFHKSIFNGINNQWFDPSISWKNKWKVYMKDKRVEKFMFSSTMFVFVTDAWHSSQALFLLAFSLSCYFSSPSFLIFLLNLVLFRVVFEICMRLFIHELVSSIKESVTSIVDFVKLKIKR